MLTISCVIIIQKRKTCCYVDYDQTTGEDDVIQSAASLTWPGTSSSVQQESDECLKHCARESVTYEDEDISSSSTANPPIIRGRFYNNQFSVSRVHPGNWMHSTASGYDVIEMSLFSSFKIIISL